MYCIEGWGEAIANASTLVDLQVFTILLANVRCLQQLCDEQAPIAATYRYSCLKYMETLSFSPFAITFTKLEVVPICVEGVA